MSEAMMQKNGLAVLGILIEVSVPFLCMPFIPYCVPYWYSQCVDIQYVCVLSIIFTTVSASHSVRCFLRQVKRLISHMVVFLTIWDALDMQVRLCVCLCVIYCVSAFWFKNIPYIRHFCNLIYYRTEGGYPIIWFTVSVAWQSQPIFPLQWLTHHPTLPRECPLDHLQWKG